MLAQTPVQIAWVTPNLDGTEAALSGLLGANIGGDVLANGHCVVL